jgi:hypothetical protein
VIKGLIIQYGRLCCGPLYKQEKGSCGFLDPHLRLADIKQLFYGTLRGRLDRQNSYYKEVYHQIL